MRFSCNDFTSELILDQTPLASAKIEDIKASRAKISVMIKLHRIKLHPTEY